MSGLDDDKAMRSFVDTVADAYRALMGLGDGDDVIWDLRANGDTGSIQVTLMGSLDAALAEDDVP